MREIKFRAWNKKLGRFMITGDPQPIIHPDGYIDFGQYRFYVDGLEYTEDDIEINLWTGLCDRSGREVYEGDIITAYCPRFPITPTVFKVHWGCAGFMATAKHPWGGYFEEDLRYLMKIEVIGNIYETPELLEEEAK